MTSNKAVQVLVVSSHKLKVDPSCTLKIAENLKNYKVGSLALEHCMPTDTKIVNFVPVYSIHSIEKYSCSYSVGPVASYSRQNSAKFLP